MFRICSECSVNVQNVQNMFRIFSHCSECSEYVQNLKSMSVSTFSELLAQKLVYSEFLDFVVYAFLMRRLDGQQLAITVVCIELRWL
jgi:hypothetical protein